MPACLNPNNLGRSKLARAIQGREKPIVVGHIKAMMPLDSPKAQSIISGWNDGLTLSRISENAHTDPRTAWIVITRAADAGIIPPLADALRERTKGLLARTQDALEEELSRPQEDRDAGLTKAYWVGIGIGTDKVGIAPAAPASVHEHRHVHVEVGNDAASKYLRLLEDARKEKGANVAH